MKRSLLRISMGCPNWLFCATAALLLLLLQAAGCMAQQPITDLHFQYQIPRGVQVMGSVSQFRIASLENSIASAFNASGYPPALASFVQRSGWSITYAIIFTLLAIVIFIATFVIACVECCRHSCNKDNKRGLFSNPRDAYRTPDKVLARLLLIFLIILILFGACIAMYANTATFQHIPESLRQVNETLATSTAKTQSVLDKVRPIAADYNINIPREVDSVNRFLRDTSKLVSNGTDAGTFASNTAKALGTLPWIFPLVTALLAIPFVVRAWRGFAKLAAVLALVSLFLVLLLSAPYALIGFTTTGECANNLRQGLMNYVGNSTSDECAADVIQYYLLCVPLNSSGSACNPVDSLKAQINKAIQDLTTQINSNPNDPRREKWISDRDTLNSTLPDVNYLTTCLTVSSTYVSVEQTFCHDIAAHSGLLFEIIFDSLFILPMFIISILFAYYRLDPETDALGSGSDVYHSLDHVNTYSNMIPKLWPMILAFVIVVILSALALSGLIVSVTIGRQIVTVGA